MTYKELLVEMHKFTPEQLNHDVLIWTGQEMKEVYVLTEAEDPDSAEYLGLEVGQPYISLADI